MRPAIITINEMELLSYEPPKAEMRISCSKGTYIRSLARDLGIEAGSGAYLANLRRTINGSYLIKDAMTIDDFVKMINEQ
mgnify:FL=1